MDIELRKLSGEYTFLRLSMITVTATENHEQQREIIKRQMQIEDRVLELINQHELRTSEAVIFKNILNARHEFGCAASILDNHMCADSHLRFASVHTHLTEGMKPLDRALGKAISAFASSMTIPDFSGN